MTTLVIDESGDDFEDVHRYVIGAGVVLPAAGRLDAVRREAEGLLMATENRSRPFHWLKEGPHLRLSMIDLIGRLDVHVYAVAGSAPSRHDIEFLRDKCLRELFRSVRQHAVDRVVIESRERSTSVIGQNRRDYGTLIEARHAGELGAPRMGAEERSAGVARRRRRRSGACQRARRGGLAPQAPPRLYSTGLKTLRAPTGMPTPLFVRERGPSTAQNPVPLPFR